jgi:hypothetical protein
MRGQRSTVVVRILASPFAVRALDQLGCVHRSILQKHLTMEMI